MNLLTSNKFIFSLMGVGSIIVVGAVKDYSNHRVVSSNVEVSLDEVAIERNLASEAVSKVAQMYLPMNDENIKKINGAWEIVRIVDSKEQVAFDKNQNIEDSKKTIEVKMDLIGNGIVRIDNDNEQVYRVSLLSNFGTIALFKKVDNGYEILEAKRIISPSISENKLEVTEEVELVLERALNQVKSPKILTGNDISGELTLKSKSISNLSVELRNPNGETQNVSIDFADLMDGGAFKAEVNGEEVSGVVFNNGKDGYRLSFVTGPMAGAMLNFVTKEQLQNIQSNEVDTTYEENAKAEEVKNAQQEVMEERQMTAQNTEVQVEAPALTTEEVKEVAQEQGFAF